MLSVKIAALCVVFVAIGVQCEGSDNAMCLIACPPDYPILLHPCECARQSGCRMGCVKDDEIAVDTMDGKFCRCRKPWHFPGRK
ncbi:hypothetical protein Ddc_10138 [Ditylenchus destructor]|nr:hypothetical protein Ddc_10138 [Ditylenchus destructor]